ncbi:hypothetical protein ABT099_23390 [Streptomyces prasinus]|uniref:hypothetical protein n=1 Tax=Streptomyces prasinus TaxID=67345 RepID=UPI00332544C5
MTTSDSTELFPEDLVFEHEAVAATGVPGTVIRQWARRGKIRRFKGRPSEYSGQGHEYKTMYALPEVEARAATYRPMPQRAPRAA